MIKEIPEPKTRQQSGQVTVELACVAFLFVVLTLLCVDAAVLMMATSTLDEAVRDAGRAAAEQPDKTKAQNAADQAAKKHLGTNNPLLTNLNLTVTDYQSVADAGCIDSTSGTTGLTPCGAGQMQGTPFVKLNAKVDAHVPAPIFFFGASFGEGGTLTFQQVATFPILNIAPPPILGVFDPDPPFRQGDLSTSDPCLSPAPGCPSAGGGGPTGPGTSGDSGPTGPTGGSAPPG
jgi:hypothetical protein